MLAGVTAIEPSSLSQVAKPLCIWSGPLLDPAPSYNPTSDTVQCWQRVTFGKHDWPLPAVLMTHADPEARIAVFAMALLEGQVLPVFQSRSSQALLGYVDDTLMYSEPSLPPKCTTLWSSECGWPQRL